MRGTGGLPRLRVLAVGAAALASSMGANQAFAQSATPAPPSAPRGVVTRVLAIGTLTAKATATDTPAVLEREVPATLKLYLAGRIADWYAKTDQTGVVFILNVETVEEARALLEPLPLGVAGMMTFQLTPLGPLRPLAMLLRAPSEK